MININANDYTQMARLSIPVHKQVKAMATADNTTMSKIIESLLEGSGNTCFMRLEQKAIADNIELAKGNAARAELALSY